MSDVKPGIEGAVAFETGIGEPGKEGGLPRDRGVEKRTGLLTQPSASYVGPVSRPLATLVS